MQIFPFKSHRLPVELISSVLSTQAPQIKQPISTMSAYSPGSWLYLPPEIRSIILQHVAEDRPRAQHYATVSREWQPVFEHLTFARLHIHHRRLLEFRTVVNRRRMQYVQYIWFRIILDRYNCTGCTIARISDDDNYHIMSTIKTLFQVLTSFDPQQCSLQLDITVYSPSDNIHCFKHLTFWSDRPSLDLIHQPVPRESYSDRGWTLTHRGHIPCRESIGKVFATVLDDHFFTAARMDERRWWEGLPRVPCVTSLLLRLQTRRKWKPMSLVYMISRMPSLREIYYEPWAECDRDQQALTDVGEYLPKESPLYL